MSVFYQTACTAADKVLLLGAVNTDGVPLSWELHSS